MSVRGVILLCFVVVIPCATISQGQPPSGMPLNVVEAPVIPQPVIAPVAPVGGPITPTAAPVAPLPIQPSATPPAFQDVLAPTTGTPPLLAQAQLPVSAPAPAAPPVLPPPEVPALGPLPPAETTPAVSVPVVTPPAVPVPTIAAVQVQPASAAVQVAAADAQGLAAILAPTEALPADQGAAVPAPTVGKVIATSAASLKEADSKEGETKDIYLNFDNTELANFINYMAEIKKLNLIPDKGIEGNKISLTIREPLSVEGAWNVFLTVIEMAGFSIVQVGDVYKIVPKDKKATQPLPAYINIPVDKIPDNDSNIRYVMFLTNLQAGDMKDLVQSMLSDKSSVVEVKDVNGMIITDKCFNIKTAVRVLQELDQMGTAETVTVMRLKNANAADVKTLLETIIKQPEVSPLARLLGKTAEGGTQFFPPGTRIIAEERTNSLILLGNPKPIKKIEEFITNHIDTELQDAKSPLHVFELQYTDASQIAEILNEVTQAGDSTAGQAAAKYGAIRGGVKYFKKMNFKVDKDGNRLIVSSTDKVDWKLLKQTIRDLDKPQPQVAIETLIVTVDVTDVKKINGAMRLKKSNMLGQNIGFQSAPIADAPSLALKESKPDSLLGNLFDQVAGEKGLSVFTIGKKGSVWSLFEMLKSQTNASVLSQPFITATNKASAKVTVGGSQRVVQEQQGGSGGIKGYTDAKYDTTVEITPQINIDGIIRLKIKTAMSEFTNEDATQTTERKLETDVTVADGQVLVLGGFVKTKVTENKWKTPILGDLPLLGWFFKTQRRDVVRQYLFMFMCPTIIKPRQQPGMGLYTKMKLHEVTDSVEETIQTKKLPDPIHNWFFNAEKENYSHKVIDFANARYQPTTVDIQNDPYYRTETYRQRIEEEVKEKAGKETETKKAGVPIAVKTPTKMPALFEKSLQPLPTQVATTLQLEQKREGMKNLLSTQAPIAPEPILVVPEKRTQIKELISHIPETVSTPVNKQNVSPLASTPEVDDKRAQFKELISTKEEVPQQFSSAPSYARLPASNQQIASDFVQATPSKAEGGPATTPTSIPGEELTVDVGRRNRLKEFLSNNPAIASNTPRFTVNRRSAA